MIRWSLIAGRLPGRTDNEIKNYWNTNLSKRIQDQEAGSLSKAGGKDVPKSKAASPLSHNVVRTKAAKCTKVLINPHYKGLFLLDDHEPVDHHQQVDHQPNTDHGLSASPSSSSSFRFDFGINSELRLSNLLGSDFASGDDHLFSEELLLQQQYWSGNVGGDCVVDDHLQPNMVLNFQSLNSFLDGDADQGEWLGLAESS